MKEVEILSLGCLHLKDFDLEYRLALHRSEGF